MLERDQAAIAATLLHGPAHAPSTLFAGNAAQILRGLRVHANTISHARLVALEETFPHCRTLLGAAGFNRLSRAFLDTGAAQNRALADIGARFPDWLEGEGEPRAADLARIEWAWLESYHAADAPALVLADLATCDEAALLALRVRRHPAARTVAMASDAASVLDPALADAAVLLAARPDADVRLHALTAAEASVLALADHDVPLGTLIAPLADRRDGAAILSLIAAGAFEKRMV